MNILHQVTIQSLKKNKIRTIVTIIGVLLSAAMICAVTTTISSFQNYLLENEIYTEGDWHGWAESTSWDTYPRIMGSGDVESASYAQQIGYANINSENEYKPYLYILGANDKFLETMPIHLISGAMPTNESELLLPNHLYENGGVHYKIGDTITLDIGYRILDGESLGQRNPCYTYDVGREVLLDETLEIRETRTYTVVGTYERFSYRLEDYTAPGYTALTYRDKEVYDPYLYDVFFKMEKPQDTFAFMQENELSGSTNTDVLMFSGAAMYGSFYAVLYSLTAIVVGLIMFGSISLIYNAFSISVSERTKQFGLLSSIGATRKQLKRMVLFEALSVSAIGIPLGILVGIGGIAVTLQLIGHKFTSLLGNPIAMRVCISPLSVVIACVISLVTVLLSAWIPSKRATRISAIEAIRQQNDIHNTRPSRTSRITYKLFGLPGVLASKYYKRNRKKYRATVLSLFMSIVLFVSASAFSDYLMESVSATFAVADYDLVYYSYAEDLSSSSPDQLLQDFQETDSITNAAYLSSMTCRVTASDEYLSQDSFTYADSMNIYFEGTDDATDVSFLTSLHFINDEVYKEFLMAHDLDVSEYMNPEAPKAIALDYILHFDPNEEKYQQIHLLRENPGEVSVTLENPETGIQTVKSISIGTILYDFPYYVDISTFSIPLLYPYSMQETVLSEDYGLDLQYFMQSNDHTTGYNQLKITLADHGLNTSNLYDYADWAEDDRNLITILQVFAYGFIVLISMIAAANVFNTISTNISLRRREFAMLKSVGMTQKGFHRMMNYECILYGTRALFWGLPVSVGITYLIHQSVNAGYSMNFHLPWTAMGIATLSVFAVVFITMMYAMSKIKKENPIDALKNENL